MEIVLYQPEIPQNTGNVGRLCVALGLKLHLIRPFGFSLDDRQVKRAGLDYWPHVQLACWDDWASFLAVHEEDRCRFFTTKTENSLWEADLPGDAILVFGPESRGLPEPLLREKPSACVKLPMLPGPSPVRSLNLAVSVGIASYEWARRHPAGYR
jgi:tRNA (cytidine/uridine-2'-O-)-methyltransferase